MKFPVPDEGARIKVIGVGCGGGNALNAMVGQQVQRINWIAVDTDSAALEQSLAPQKVLIGAEGLGGTGAHADPKQATRPSLTI